MEKEEPEHPLYAYDGIVFVVFPLHLCSRRHFNFGAHAHSHLLLPKMALK